MLDIFGIFKFFCFIFVIFFVRDVFFCLGVDIFVLSWKVIFCGWFGCFWVICNVILFLYVFEIFGRVIFFLIVFEICFVNVVFDVVGVVCFEFIWIVIFIDFGGLGWIFMTIFLVFICLVLGIFIIFFVFLVICLEYIVVFVLGIVLWFGIWIVNFIVLDGFFLVL